MGNQTSNSGSHGPFKDVCGLVLDPSSEEEPAISDCRTKTPIWKSIGPSFGHSDKGLNGILLKGDNFQALYSMFLLSEGKGGFADVVYADPPYNTDYHYDKSFGDSSKRNDDEFRHSDWLRRLRARLVLAEAALSPDGVFFMSIDDGEMAASKLLCDQVFGEANSLGTIIWDKRSSHSNSVCVESRHEYILAYRKSDLVKRILSTRKESGREIFEDRKGKYVLVPCNYVGSLGLNERPDNGYVVYANPVTGGYSLSNDYDREAAGTSNDDELIYAKESLRLAELEKDGFVRARPDRYNGRLGCWAWSFDKASKELASGKVVLAPNGAGNYKFFRKTYLESGQTSFFGEAPLPSILEYPSCEGTRSLRKDLGRDSFFTYPKNVELMKRLIGSYYRKDAVVLDFYAGSGTTARAVMELNKEDGGARRLILCTNDESGIFSKCCLPRVKALATGVREDGSALADGPFQMEMSVCEVMMKDRPSADDIAFSKAAFDKVRFR